MPDEGAGAPDPPDPPDRPTRIAWAAESRARLRRSLDLELGDRLVRDGQEKVAWEDWVRIGGFDLGERCLARWAGPSADDYRDTTRTTARRFALGALSERRPGEPPGAALDRALEDHELWPSGLWSFWQGLDRSGRAAVRAAALTWAVGALVSVGGREVTWVRPARPLVRQVEGRRIELRANWDATFGGAADPTTLVIVSPAAPGPMDRYRSGFAALVAGLGRGCVPLRVRHASPTTGSHRAEAVTPSLLELAVDRVVELAAAAAVPDSASVTPGTWCASCHLLGSCDEGRAAVGDGFGVPARGGAGQPAEADSEVVGEATM